MPEWITVSAAARRLDIAERTVRDRIHKGKLIAKREGNKWLIDEDSIGGNIAEEPALAAAIPATGGNTIPMPLERYEALLTRVGQLQAENDNYRLLLEDKRDLEAENSQLREDKTHLQKELEDYRRQLEETQRTLAYHQGPWYRRWFRKQRRMEENRS